MKFVKQLMLNIMICSSIFGATEIGKYKIIDIDEYLKNPNHEEINQYYQKGLLVICDEAGNIAHFKGINIEDNIYQCDAAIELSELMSSEDKKKTYLRRFNGDLQFWVIDI